MEDVSLMHAKDHLEELIERAAKGEEIRIRDPKFGIVEAAAHRGLDQIRMGSRVPSGDRGAGRAGSRCRSGCSSR